MLAPCSIADNSVLSTDVTNCQMLKQQTISDNEDLKRHHTPCVDKIP